jgi:hypothetical protein
MVRLKYVKRRPVLGFHYGWSSPTGNGTSALTIARGKVLSERRDRTAVNVAEHVLNFDSLIRVDATIRTPAS